MAQKRKRFSRSEKEENLDDPMVSSARSSLAPSQNVSTIVDQLFEGVTSTHTKSGWCIRQGMTHVLSVDGGRMIPLVESHGLPKLYKTLEQNQENCRHPDTKSSPNTAPTTSFESLCRIIAGQQLAGAAAHTIWNRLLETTQFHLTPKSILQRAVDADTLEHQLRKPAGLSRSKAKSIVALATAFEDTEHKLSEDFLAGNSPDIRETLLEIPGIGPWTCDMFQMFSLEHSNVLPLGDLGVRKGILRVFRLKPHGKYGTLCPKKDLEPMQTALAPYQPYQSLVTYYMWKAADVKDVYLSESNQMDNKVTPSTPISNKRAKKQAPRRQVTP